MLNVGDNIVYLGTAKPASGGGGSDNAANKDLSNLSASGEAKLAGDVWQKPADWIDIRSGAIPNSVYFLVGHSADYSTYPKFSLTATITNAGTYDVFVDGIKQATTASGSDTELVWSTLALTSGYDVTTPAALKAHIVRVTPSSSSNQFSAIKLVVNSSVEQGVLWAHTTCDYAVNYTQFLSAHDTNSKCLICKAFTGNNGNIYINWFSGAVRNCSALEWLDTIDGKNSSVELSLAFKGCGLDKIKLKNLSNVSGSYDVFYDTPNLKKINTDNVKLQNLKGSVFRNCPKLESLPTCSFLATQPNYLIIRDLDSLGDTFLDLQDVTASPKFTLAGTSSRRMNGLKGVALNPNCVISGNSPQIDVSYTGLNKAALVNLFNSMPYNVGYTTTGSPTITDGVVSGFSASNYLQVVSNVANSAITEMVWKCKLSSSALGGNTSYVFYKTGGNLQLSIYGGTSVFNAPVLWVPGPNASYAFTDFVPEADTWFWLKMTYDGSTLKLYSSLDGTNYTLRRTEENITMTCENGTYNIGYSYGTTGYFRGEIDLNETYIKANGVMWFRGNAYTTKTCSVVDCTGTADLTEADKAIAMDKGWSLTLSRE